MGYLLFEDDGPIDGAGLQVSVNGNGRVTSEPGGINCGSDCTQNYALGTAVTLSATPDPGYQFSNWTGDCSSTNCNLTMSQDRQVTAVFTALPEFTLTVTQPANGFITSSPAGINCATDCTQSFYQGQEVTLTATPDSGYRLDSWSGDCSGGGNCVLTMNSNQEAGASFVEVPDQDLTIADMGTHTIAHGNQFTFQPSISGNHTICRKDLGHDDVKVDSETGAISWDTSNLNFGRGFYIRIKCSNATESAYGSMVVHVDKSGTSRLRIAGQDGVSPYIGVAGQAMTSGDTIVFPDGVYPVSVSGDSTYENAFKTTAPTDGTSEQFSTLIARTPGGVTISGAPQNGIGKQKNAFQLSATNYVALAGFVVRDVQRESLIATSANFLLIDFIGGAGAGTDLFPCSNFTEAREGECSKAGMRVNGGNPLYQNSYDWGHNRYGIMTRNTNGSITRRSFVRLDEHRGDQPYGGFSNYCDTLHLSQDNTVFDSLAIAAPHYKNYAGLEAYPQTGCESQSATLKTEGLLSVNNKLSLSLMDQQVGPSHVWDHIVSFDTEGTCTPQPVPKRCGNWLLQADKETTVRNSFFGKARGFEGATDISRPFDTTDVVLENTVVISDVPGETDAGSAPAYLPESLLYFRGKSDTFHGDTGFDQLTDSRRWPIAGEDIIAANMRSYNNPAALKVGGGTIALTGDRGATATGQSMSEYFWGYNGALVPPLVVRVKDKGGFNRVAWEPLMGSNRDSVTGWNVICVSSGDSVLATVAKDQLVYHDIGKTCSEYAVTALYGEDESGYAYTETAVASSTPDVLISDYQAAAEPFQLTEIGNNASGITWHADLQQFLVVQNNAARIYRYDADFDYLSQITKGGNINNDTEGLAFVSNNQVMIATEVNLVHKAVIDASTTVINGNYDQTPAYRLLPTSPVSNKGLEGVAVRLGSGDTPSRIYACQEGTRTNSSALMKVVYFDLPSPDPTELLSYDSTLTVVEPFNAETAFAGLITDCAGMVYDTRTGHLIVVSQESRKALQVKPDTGEVVAQLSLTGTMNYEGVTIGPAGELVFVGETNWIDRFELP